ncbi:MAG: zinc metallopeptidase [Candidatus Gastranaerophilales bacterium]|nr:zinc metallopeptidase [Candidatus Gastranaerophilales bacterium]
MFFYEPIYMFVSILGMALVFLPQLLVKSTYSKYARVGTSVRATGADVARSILNNAGLTDVRVEPIGGELSDHYDPSKKVVRLSEAIYHGSSISAFGIAAHEAGHAIQDKQGYLPMKLRAGIFPAVQAGQMLGPLLIMAGLGLRYFAGMGEFTNLIALTGIALYGSVVLFHLVTLPVEFNASGRAIKALASGGYLVDNREINGAKAVLTAAALTYVAVALYALVELLYWIWVLFGRRRD